MEELTEDIRTRLAGGKRLEQAAEARDAVVQKLLDMVEVPIPDQVASEELQARRQNIEQQLSFAGMTMEQYLDNEGQTQEEFDAELDRQVREGVATQFILDQLAKDEEIGIEQQELSEHMMRRAQQSGQNPQEYIQHALEHNHVPELVAEVVRGKALATIVESATVTDESGAVVDLKNLRGDGTLADPDEQPAEVTDEADEATDEATDGGAGHLRLTPDLPRGTRPGVSLLLCVRLFTEDHPSDHRRDARPQHRPRRASPARRRRAAAPSRSRSPGRRCPRHDVRRRAAGRHRA